MVLESDIRLLDSLVAGSLEMLCRDICFVFAHDNSQVIARGSGRVKSNPWNQLSVKVLLEVLPARDLLNKMSAKKAGELYSEDEYMILLISDESNHRWKSNPLPVAFDLLAPLHKTWEGILSYICHADPLPTPATRVSAYIPKPPSLYYTSVTKRESSRDGASLGHGLSVDHHTHISVHGETVFEQVEKALMVKLQSEKTLEEASIENAISALRLLTVTDCSPCGIFISSGAYRGLRVLSGPYVLKTSLMPSPILHGRRDDFWSAISLYQSFLESRQDRSTISSIIYDVLRGSQISFDAACLTLSIGIESLSRVLLSEGSGQISKQELKILHDCLKGAAGVDPDVIKRAKAKLADMRSTSTADRLHAWAGNYGIDPNLISHWKKLRHRTAHGVQINDAHEHTTAYYGCIELFYRLILSLSGYKGSIIEFSKSGWNLTKQH